MDRTERALKPATRWPLLLAALIVVTATDDTAQAYPHLVRRGESLSSIAQRAYGRVELESVLVAANGLEGVEGPSLTPGMRIEIPSVEHVRADTGATWRALAEEHLGDPSRGDWLATANGTEPWLLPTEGQEVALPFNLRYVVQNSEPAWTIARRFYRDETKAPALDAYNGLHGKPAHRGQVLLLPLMDLALTAEGKAEAASALATVRSAAGGRDREAQRRVVSELPLLTADVRGGRYIDVVTRGNQLLGAGTVAKPERASVERILLEAYVALDAAKQAEIACRSWRDADPATRLDPIELSPKIIRACTAAVTGDPLTTRSTP
jgi:phage tail protein X